MAYFRVSNAANHTDWTRIILGQSLTNNGFIDVNNQANTKGNLLLQPWGGNIGIGTTSPVGRLDVWDGVHSTAAATATMYIRHAANSADNHGAAVAFENTDGANANRKYLGKIGSFRENNAGNYNAYLGFYTSDGASYSERMRISQAGNVGIGTASPRGKLDIYTCLLYTSDAADE